MKLARVPQGQCDIKSESFFALLGVGIIALNWHTLHGRTSILT